MKTFQSVADICQLIFDNLNSENELLRNHAQTLMGPRRHGSTTERPLSFVPKCREVFHLNDPNKFVSKGCVGYTFTAPELGGRKGALPLLDVASLGLEQFVREGEGPHGPQLEISRSDIPCEVWERFGPAENITVIVGEYEGEEAVFTWHPGQPLKPYTGERESMTAVKVVE